MYYINTGMVLSVNLGFANLSNPDAEDEQGKVYALFIGDIVQVNEVRMRVISEGEERRSEFSFLLL